jgi:hypothetical protein
MLARNLNLDTLDPKVNKLKPRSSKRNSIATLPIANPTWLKFLLSAQSLSVAVTTVAAVSVFGVYSWNVNIQKNFDQQYRKLEDLRRTERQLIVAKEALDHNLITNLDRLPNKLVREKPEQSFFMAPAPLRPTKPNPVETDKSKRFVPLAY